MSVRPGDIGFSGSKSPNFFQRAVMFFSKSRWSHCFFISDSIFGEETVQEASLSVDVIPFRNYRFDTTTYYEVYRLNAATKDQLEYAVARCFDEFAGVEYGFFQIPWFIWRWLNEKLGRDIRKQKNWYSKEVICSENDYWMIHYTGGVYPMLLNEVDADTCWPEDLYKVVKTHPELFTLVEMK